ncbi:MAG: PAS domain S-box protein [Phycisphaerae bacterium]|nr:PAS domain S-box protein [Phycisphaerae bacterium]
MIWYVDQSGTILRANKPAAEFIGMPVSSLIGKDYYQLFSAHHHVTAAEDHAIIKSGRPRYGTITRIETPDGRMKWLRLDRIPWIDRADHVTGITIFASDITEAREAEDQLKTAKAEIEQINAQLRTAAQQARTYADEAIAANRIKSRFLANVTHELRTPMNAIIGYGDLLAEEQLSGEQKQYLAIIQRSAENLLALIDDVLDFSKIEAGKLDVNIRPCDPRQLLTEIHELMRHTAQRKGLTLDLDIAELPAALCTDAGRLRQCLMNLVGNALKFTSTGSVHISTAVFGPCNEPLLRIDVRDTGIGIAADKQQYIFESFAQAAANSTGGTGLGLTITRRLMDLLGGTVELVSEIGKGSTFSLILPITRQPASAEAIPSHAGPAEKASSSQSIEPS